MWSDRDQICEICGICGKVRGYSWNLGEIAETKAKRVGEKSRGDLKRIL